MHILLINHYAGSPAMGMEFRPYYLASEWLKMGHNTTIVAASYSHVRHIQPKIYNKVNSQKIDGINYVWIKTPAYVSNDRRRIFNIISFLRGLYSFKKWLEDRIDVVISSSTYTLDIFPARTIAKNNNSKLIYEVHDLWPLSPIELGGYSKTHPFIIAVQMAENYAYKYSDQVISILPTAKQHMIDHGLDPDKFHHIPNGINLTDWQMDEADKKTIPVLEDLAKFKKEGFFIFGYTGSVGLANALHAFINSAILLKDKPIKFIILGDGPERKNLMEMINRANLKNVIMYKPVPKTDVPIILAVMDAFYIGLKHHALFKYGISPNKLIDYMMAGKPIVQAIEAGNDPVKEANCGLTVKAESPEDIAKGVMQIYQMDNSEKKKMGENGKRYAKAQHDYRILAQKFIDVINI